ncbi:MAG: nucleoside deaminase [Cyclobacteriaceae bacterium]
MEKNDAYFISVAIELAREGMQANLGGPFGAIVVRDQKIIGRGQNRVTSSHDPTAHAEVNAIRDACQQLDTFVLDGCTLYTSCEPCPMCLGAIYWARIARIVFAATREDAARGQFDDAWLYQEVMRPWEERDIEFLQLAQGEGAVVFDEWREKEDRVKY